MKGFALGLSLSIAFILGCAAAPLIVPRMSAQQQVTVQRWEYTCEEIGWRRASEALPRYGVEGWEIATTSGGGTFCFKRPL